MRRSDEVEGLLLRLFRVVDRRKSVEVAALLDLIEPLVSGRARRHVIVDLACGKSYLLHATAALLGPDAQYYGVDRNQNLLEQSRSAAQTLGMTASFLRDAIASAPLPEQPDVVLSLHACGSATDDAVTRAVALRARHLFVVPCCHVRPPRAQLEAFGLPTQGVLRGRISDALTDSRRALRLEADGYEVVANEFVPAAVTPHNLLLRARYVGATGRATRARASLARLSGLLS